MSEILLGCRLVLWKMLGDEMAILKERHWAGLQDLQMARSKGIEFHQKMVYLTATELGTLIRALSSQGATVPTLHQMIC